MNHWIPVELEERTILTIEETCKLLHITKNTLYDLLRTGKIRAFQLQRKWMIPSKSILEYIESALKEGVSDKKEKKELSFEHKGKPR